MVNKSMTKLSEEELNYISGGGVASGAAGGFLFGLMLRPVGALMGGGMMGDSPARKQSHAEAIAEFSGLLAGYFTVHGALVGVGYALAKRKKIVRWVKGKFSKK